MKFNFIFNITFGACMRFARCVPALIAFLLAFCLPSFAQEKPYFITYSHDMEEPGNLEIATSTAIGTPRGGGRFFGTATEFEYGVKAWWTTEVYVEGQTTLHD